MCGIHAGTCATLVWIPRRLTAHIYLRPMLIILCGQISLGPSHEHLWLKDISLGKRFTLTTNASIVDTIIKCARKQEKGHCITFVASYSSPTPKEDMVPPMVITIKPCVRLPGVLWGSFELSSCESSQLWLPGRPSYLQVYKSTKVTGLWCWRVKHLPQVVTLSRVRAWGSAIVVGVMCSVQAAQSSVKLLWLSQGHGGHDLLSPCQDWPHIPPSASHTNLKRSPQSILQIMV